MLDYSRTHSGFDTVAAEYDGHLWPEAQPYHLRADPPSDTIVLGLHGFRATPYELRPVHEACCAAGFDGMAPLLEGHGYRERREQIEAIRWMFPRSIEQAIVNEVARCRARGYRRVLLYGHSMGGALALRLAGHGLVDAVAVTAPALTLPRIALLAELVPQFLDLRVPSLPERGVKNFTYPFDPAQAVVKVNRIATRARAVLDKVSCPVLVVHSHGDRTIDHRVGRLVEKRCKGPVRRLWFDDSGHCMTLDVSGPAVAKAIADFFQAL